MKYYIAYLLTGDPEKRHNYLTYEIEKRFGFVRTNPPHVTLKRPFETDLVAETERFLESFVKTHKKEKIAFKGFGAFEKDVIFAEVKLSSEATALIAAFDAEIKKIPGMEFDDYEKNRKLHSTLVDKGNIKKVFRPLWDFITLGTFDFSAWLDNIAIMKKSGKKYTVYKQYFLK